MRKIPTIFERDWSDPRHPIVDKPNPACAWVFAGEGVATRKWDGTSCMVRAGQLWKRRELRRGEAAPAGFELEQQDAETGKAVGWVPVGTGPEDRWHREAWAALTAPAEASGAPPDGTYELIGPKVQGNPECAAVHRLEPHASAPALPDCPRTFERLRAFLAEQDTEGVVFHHPDGRMGKIKLRDFGLKRPRTTAARSSASA
jgi:hypothetical protein